MPIFTHVPLGGAGAVIGISSAPSINLLLAKTDQYGCYKSVNNSRWVQLNTIANMPRDGIATLTAAGAPIANGADECVSDTNGNIWMGTNGSMYLSKSGAAFTTTCYPAQGASKSQSQSQAIKSMGHTIAIDPNNSSVVYLSTPSNGLYFTHDQGATCSQISTSYIPLAETVTGGAGGGHLIAFDTSGGTIKVSGQVRTAIVWATSYGHGLYKSIDGGQTFNPVSGSPFTHWYLAVNNFGDVYEVDNSTSNQSGVAWRYNGSTWTNYRSQLGSLVTGVAVNPNNCPSSAACQVTFTITGGNGTGMATSLNGGTSFGAIATRSRTFITTDVPWISTWISGFGLYSSGAAYDNNGHVYVGGEGVYFSYPPTTGGTRAAITYTSQTLGIEEGLIGTVLTSPSMSGRLTIGTWDINCFTMFQPYTSPPTTSNRGCGSTNAAALQRTNSIDWASASPSTLFALTDNQGGYLGGGHTNYSAISTDGGRTWPTALGPPSAVSSGGLIEGCVAAAGATNAMWAPTDGSGGAVQPFYTANAGASPTWTQLAVTGSAGGWPWRYYLTSKICAADRVLSNTYYFYNWNLGDGRGDAFIKCVTTTCTIQSRPRFNSQYVLNHKTMPGQAGTAFFSYAISTPFADNPSFGFYYTTNGWSWKTRIPGFTMVAAFGFGATAPGHSMPSIAVVGFYNHKWGIWESTDWDTTKTWRQVGDYPMGLPVTISDVDGDKAQLHVWYYGSNSGVFCSATSTSYCNNSF